MGLTFLTSVIIYIFYIASFFMIIFIKNPIDPIYYVISTSLMIGFLLFWLITFAELVFKDKKRLFMIISIIILSIFESIYYYLFIVYGQSALIVSVDRGLWVKSTLFVTFYLVLIFLIFLLTAIIFVTITLRSDNKEIRLKGRILLIGLICLVVGNFFESVVPLRGFFFILTRTFQILGVSLFYIGFSLPNWVKKIFKIE